MTAPAAVTDPWLRAQWDQVVRDPVERAAERERARLENVAYYRHEQEHREDRRPECRWCAAGGIE